MICIYIIQLMCNVMNNKGTNSFPIKNLVCTILYNSNSSHHKLPLEKLMLIDCCDTSVKSLVLNCANAIYVNHSFYL